MLSSATSLLSDSQLKSHVRRSIKTHGISGGGDIAVSVDGANVRLIGTVMTSFARSEVVDAVRQTDGVREIEVDIHIDTTGFVSNIP